MVHRLRGEQSRSAAERELMERGMVDGRFLLRLKEQVGEETVFAVSYSYDGEFHHHLLVKRGDDNFRLNRKSA